MRSLEHNFIFIHGRKAGGSAIKRALGPYCDSEHFLHSGSLSGRTEPGEVDHDEGIWRRQDFASFAIAANVRNPFDRTVSAYRYFGLGARIHGRRMGFDEFVERLPPRSHDYQDWLHVTANYSTYLCDEVGPIYTHLLRFECLQQDFDQFTADVGLPVAGPLERVNSSNLRITERRSLLRSRTGGPSLRGAIAAAAPRGYRSYYSRNARRLVEDHFAEDLERFDYEF